MNAPVGIVTRIIDLCDLGKISDARLMFSTHYNDIPEQARVNIETGLTASEGATWKKVLGIKSDALKKITALKFENELRKALSSGRK